jgi:voltage-gated potassium channel
MTNHIRAALGLIGSLLVAGTLGYWAIEGWTPLDSLYMTVITLSTVGFGELRPLSPLGKVFTTGLILLGVGSLAYAAAKTSEALLERRVLYRRRLQREINRMRNHVIVCGFGRMGETVCGQLTARGVPVVVVDRDPPTDRLEEAGILHIRGDATDDAVLQQAGVQRARALAAVVPHDADNLFIALSARGLNPELTIVTRASSEKNESKMLAAGATRVLNPFLKGGRLLVRQLLHPTVTEFFDVITGEGEGKALGLEEVQLQPGSSLAGVTLRDAPLRAEMGLMVIGVRRPGQQLIFNPPHDLAPQAGDVLVVLGPTEKLRRLEQIAAG